MAELTSSTHTGPNASCKELLARLVSFDTTSHLTNLPLLEFVRGYLNEHGIESHLIFDDTGEKANLHALIGPNVDGGIGLSGHTDVVPVTGQVWTADPFTMREHDGRLYGRGTTDMKGYLACVLACVPYFKRCALKRPIQILFSYDEEIGCIGVRPMIAKMGDDLPTPGAVIVGEPTNLSVVDAHKGPALWQVRVTGMAGHTSMPAVGVNAISYAGLVLGELAAIGDEMARGARDERFNPPVSTLQVTTISGGSASNIIPASCDIGFGVRGLPGFDIHDVSKRLESFFAERCLPQMRAVAPDADIALELIGHVPPFLASKTSAAVSLALAARGHNETFAVSYATEAGLFHDGGAPSVVCGPGSIAQAHTADEWVEVSELEACVAFLERLADSACV